MTSSTAFFGGMTVCAAFMTAVVTYATGHTYLGLARGKLHLFIRASLGCVFTGLFFTPLFATWLHHAEHDERRQQAVTDQLKSLSRAITDVLWPRIQRPERELMASGEGAKDAEVSQLKALVGVVLDLSVQVMGQVAHGNWHLGVMLVRTTGPNSHEVLYVAAASSILRNSDGMQFSMREGEGVGGQMWAEWHRRGVASARSLDAADRIEGYVDSRLLPPQDLDVSKSVSSCGLCVILPPSVQHPRNSFPGLLCLGSNDRRDFDFFRQSKAQRLLSNFAQELSPLIGLIVRLENQR